MAAEEVTSEAGAEDNLGGIITGEEVIMAKGIIMAITLVGNEVITSRGA